MSILLSKIIQNLQYRQNRITKLKIRFYKVELRKNGKVMDTKRNMVG